MSEEVSVEKDSLTLERIALTALVALLSWNVYTTQQLVTNLAVTANTVKGLESSISVVGADRYTRAEALADRRHYEDRLQRIEAAQVQLNDRVNNVESDIRPARPER